MATKKCSSVCEPDKRKSEYNKQYRQDNKESIKQYYKDNKESIKQYLENNKDKVNLAKNKRSKERKKEDPIFKLRTYVSTSICTALKTNGGSKKGSSISKWLGFPIEELKNHIESLFSNEDNIDNNRNIWMTWKNHGIYNPKTWDDKDSSTWTWNIDHIVPHSTFKYASMDCQEFSDCWALSNLRPLSAKKNLLDGSNRVRHNDSNNR